LRYVAAKSAEEASNFLLQETGVSRVLAGGTDVLVQMKSGMIEPDLIVDIKKIPGIRNITELDGFFRIGAAVSGSEVKDHENINKMLPGVVEALDLIGSTQIQGRCTMVGNLCNASPAADSVPALVAVNAKVNIIGPQGERSCNVEEIPIAPGKTSLQKGEFIVSVDIPYRPEFSSDAYLRFTPRTEMDIAVVSASVAIEMSKEGICENAKVVLGAVAPTVKIVGDASKEIVGTKLDESSLKKMSLKCVEICEPISDKRGTVEFRTEVAGVLASRAAKIAYKRAGF
jgi:carbon-monoxide dehydrogenase medium subunit